MLLLFGLNFYIHIISNTVFHVANNLQGEGVDVAVVWVKLLYTYYLQHSVSCC